MGFKKFILIFSFILSSIGPINQISYAAADAGTVDVTLTISRVTALTDLDAVNGGIAFCGEADFYALMSVAGNQIQTDIIDNQNTISPNWQHTVSVDASSQTAAISIALYDEDQNNGLFCNTADDHTDINSQKFNINIIVDLNTCKISGDFDSTCDVTIISNGTAGNRAEIQFAVRVDRPPTATPTATFTPVDTATFTPTAVDTATPTSTFTPTQIDTMTPTPTSTPTPLDTATPISTFTPTPLDTATPTSIFTPTPIDTTTPTPTFTPISETSDSTWTLFVYAIGDNNLAPYLGSSSNGLLTRLKSLQHQEERGVQMVVLFDGPEIGDSAHYILSEAGLWSVVHPDEQEVRMDESDTLKNFLEWGFNLYGDSDHYALSILGHATAVLGMGPDDSSNNVDYAYLEPNEIRDAINRVRDFGHIDVIHFDGCSFGLFESTSIVADTSQNLVDYVIASPNTGWGLFPYEVYRGLAGDSSTPGAYAQSVAKYYADELAKQSYPHTISVFDMAYYSDVKAAVSELGGSLDAYISAQDRDARMEEIRVRRGQVQIYDSWGYEINEQSDVYVDLAGFAGVMGVFPADSTGDINRAANHVTDTLGDFISYTRSQSGGFTHRGQRYHHDLTKAKGLGIFYPYSVSHGGSVLNRYTNHELYRNLTKDWGWATFISGGLLPLSVDDTEPLDIFLVEPLVDGLYPEVETSTNTPIATPTPLPTTTDTPTSIFTNTSTPTSTFTDTPIATPTPLPTATDTYTPTNTSTPTLTFTNTPTASPTPLPPDTDTPTPTPFYTSTPISTLTDTATATPTQIPIDTYTPTNTNTPISTFTDTPTVSPTPLPLDTNIPTSTSTHITMPTSTLTNTVTATPTQTPTDVYTPTSTNTPTPMFTDTPAASPTSLLADADTPTSTPTHITMPTSTLTSTATSTPLPTVTDTYAPTATPIPTSKLTTTATHTPTNTNTPIVMTVEPKPTPADQSNQSYFIFLPTIRR